MSTGDLNNHQPGEAPRPPGRRDILRSQEVQRRRNRPFIIGGIILLIAILAIPTAAFMQFYVYPSRLVTVRVEDTVYTRGDVVDFIRFHQRVAEDAGTQFQLGSSLFEALQTILDNEISYRVAPRFGITVSSQEVDREILRILGYGRLTSEELATAEMQANVQEAKRQFLNRVGLAEPVYREIVRKDLFRRKLRDHLALDVPRIQPQVHLYSIVKVNPDPNIVDIITRRLNAGESFEQIALDLSEVQDIRRTRGEEGWFPEHVLPPQVNQLAFGVDAEGNRLLEVGAVAPPIYDPNNQAYNIFYIKEYSEAREVDDASFNVLADRALNRFLADERRRMDTHTVLNSEVYDWVNRQVRIASLRPTPTVGPQLGGLDLSQFGLR